MPPRFPHGLKRHPVHMSGYEKAVLGMLGLSVTAGVYQMATSPWGEEREKERGERVWSGWKDALMVFCPVEVKDEPRKAGVEKKIAPSAAAFDVTGPSVKNGDDTTNVDFGR